MLNLEVPKKFNALVNPAKNAAEKIFRPISRKYDSAEHEYPKELDLFVAAMSGMSAGDATNSAGAGSVSQEAEQAAEVRNGANMKTLLGMEPLCWGDAGLLLALPKNGLGNSAIAAVASDEQKKRFGDRWAAMAITEPHCGSDSAAIRTTATLDGDEYVLNGEKIFVTSGERADLVVVWATLDREAGRGAIKSFVVEWGTQGMELVRLEKKLGIRASDTAHIVLNQCRIPKENLLGSEQIKVDQGFAGAMKTFDNTRPLVAQMAIGVARAALEHARELLERPGEASNNDGLYQQDAISAELDKLEAEFESARLLTLRAAWMADNSQANNMEASMCKAKAGRVGNEITLRCAALCGTLGYSEDDLLEKWARDSKILDIFEGTQQIQLLVVARRMLGLSSSELR